VPEEAWQQPLDVLDLPGRIHNLLLDTNVNTVGDLIYILEMGDDYFLKLRGLGEKALETVKETLAAYQKAQIDALVAAEATPELPEEEALVVEEVPLVDRTFQDEDMVTSVPDLVFEEAERDYVFEGETADEEAADEEETIAGVLELEEVEPEVEETLTPIDDLSQTIFIKEDEPAAPAPKKKPAVVVVKPTADETAAAEEDAKRKKRKSQPLIYYEELDKVVVKRKRKKGGDAWSDEDIDLGEL
jgi:hypothetical protein